MEYGGFEGIIPKGQYGGGTVMVWDQGTWEPQAISSDVDAALRAGSLKFILHGEKLKGKWALIRMGGKAANEKKPNWLLIKEHDEFERTSDDPVVTEAEPNSVVTGRDIDQIAHSEDHVWNSKDTAKGKAWYRNDKLPAAEAKPADKERAEQTAKPKYSPRLTAALSKAPKETLPTFVPPELALVGHQSPENCRLASRVEARRLSHSGPQRRGSCPAAHPHWSGLDAPHEADRATAQRHSCRERNPRWRGRRLERKRHHQFC